MTEDRILLQKYISCIKVYNQNSRWSQTKVERIGFVLVKKDISLNTFLYVSNLDCNLVSVSKVTQHLKCITEFFSNLCGFREMDLWKTIDSTKKCKRLHLLKGDIPFTNLAQEANCSSNSNSCKDNEIMLWHCCLGYPNFMYIEKLIPPLFNSKSPKSFVPKYTNFPNTLATGILVFHTNHLNHFSSFTIMLQVPQGWKYNGNLMTCIIYRWSH